MTTRRRRRERVWTNRARRAMREIRWAFGQGDWRYDVPTCEVPVGKYRPRHPRRRRAWRSRFRQECPPFMRAVQIADGTLRWERAWRLDGPWHLDMRDMGVRDDA